MSDDSHEYDEDALEFIEDERVRIAALHATCPKQIWLQVDPEAEQFDGWDAQTWCSDKINETDVRYVLAASRDAYIERLETGLLQVRKALCGDIHNTDDLLDLIASRDAEIAELKTVPMKYRRMAFNAQLQAEVAELAKERDQFRAELEAARAEIERLENQVQARDAELWGRTQKILQLEGMKMLDEDQPRYQTCKVCGAKDCDYETHELEMAFKAGAASRDAEVVSLTNQRDYEYVRAENAEQERDQLREHVTLLRDTLFGIRDGSMGLWGDDLINCNKALAATEPKAIRARSTK